MSYEQIGTRWAVLRPIEPTGVADPMRGIVGNETARIVGHVYVARGEHRPISLAEARAREKFGADATIAYASRAYAGDPIASETYLDEMREKR